jgi:hypothetical protein
VRKGFTAIEFGIYKAFTPTIILSLSLSLLLTKRFAVFQNDDSAVYRDCLAPKVCEMEVHDVLRGSTENCLFGSLIALDLCEYGFIISYVCFFINIAEFLLGNLR